MMTLKLALRNLLGAGMKTWLRVGVLSLAFVTIIALQGLYEGMNQQATEAMIAAELGGGQYWHEKYDPQNPLDLPDAHGPVPSALGQLAASGEAVPILAVQGFMYAGGSFRPVLLKGIEPSQHVLAAAGRRAGRDRRGSPGAHRKPDGQGHGVEGRRPGNRPLAGCARHVRRPGSPRLPKS